MTARDVVTCDECGRELQPGEVVLTDSYATKAHQPRGYPHVTRDVCESCATLIERRDFTDARVVR